MDFMFFLIGFKEFNKPLKDVGHVACYCVLPFYFSKRLKCSICGASGDINADVINRLKSGQAVAIG